jgi:hypothetical protein
MKKLVSENLNEFVHPGVGGYSIDQLNRDLRDIIKKNYSHLNMEDEDITDYLVQKVAPAFERGYIHSEDDLLNFINNQE